MKSEGKNVSLVGLFLVMVLMDKVIFGGLDSREIKSWCPIEWAIIGKTFLAKGIVP